MPAQSPTSTPVKHQYSTTTFEQMQQQIEQAQRDAEAKAKEAKPDAQKQPADQTQQNVDMSFDVHVRQTGATKQVSGLNTEESIMTVALHATDKSTQQTGTLAITNDMWLASSTPVYDEVRAFNEKFARAMGQVFSGSEGMQGMQALMAQPGAAKGMAEMAKETSKLKGVPILQVMRMGTTSNGEPLPAASEAPLPASTSPAMPTAGDVAQQTATSAVASALGGFSMGGFGHKKKPANTAPAQPADSTNKSAPADPSSSVLIESSTTLSDFSSAPVDASHFQVPAGYQQMTAPSAKASPSADTRKPRSEYRAPGLSISKRYLDRNRLRRLGRLGVRASRLANVDAALEERAILDRDALRDHVAGQRAFAANVHAVAGVDVAAHLAQHHDLAGEMFAATWPLRPTVTRLPGRLIAPSTLPSMYSDSEPVTSPLTTRLLPIVACSAAAAWAPGAAGREAAGSNPPPEAGVAGRFGSLLGDWGVLPG